MSFVVLLTTTKRVGFMVDAAILGFATGAGFAVAENPHYLATVGNTNLLLWIVRGFGTGVLKGLDNAGEPTRRRTAMGRPVMMPAHRVASSSRQIMSRRARGTKGRRRRARRCGCGGRQRAPG